jgi:uncharacterized lipoprotein YbaY
MTADEATETEADKKRGSRSFKRLLMLAIAVGAAAALAFANAQRRRLAAMSDDEIRAFLDEKLGAKVPPDQLVEIQNAVISAVRGGGYQPASPAGAVTGTVTYRERMAMPPDAVVIVEVEDTSRMDVAAEQVGIQVIENPGNVPVRFSVGFDPVDIVDSHSYSVRATITSGDRLLWTTDTNYPVITRGNPLTADLLLIAVQEPADK